jgi:hypothetical protein
VIESAAVRGPEIKSAMARYTTDPTGFRSICMFSPVSFCASFEVIFTSRTTEWDLWFRHWRQEDAPNRPRSREAPCRTLPRLASWLEIRSLRSCEKLAQRGHGASDWFSATLRKRQTLQCASVRSNPSNACVRSFVGPHCNQGHVIALGRVSAETRQRIHQAAASLVGGSKRLCLERADEPVQPRELSRRV